MTIQSARRQLHWPEYLIEATGLAIFMVAAGVATIALDYPGSTLHQAIGSPLLRRFMIGLAMGGTALCLIYSPWGARSGAHFNPALTLAFASLGKIAPADAACYVVAQFCGGVAGVELVRITFGQIFTAPPVHWIATMPGPLGAGVAFAMEALISALLMATTLSMASRTATMRFAGLACAALIVVFVTFEAPYSGMSMNPARSMGSALPSGMWHGMWIYFLAPTIGMLLAALEFHARKGRDRLPCAKLNHDTHYPCHFFCAFRRDGVVVPTLLHPEMHP